MQRKQPQHRPIPILYALLRGIGGLLLRLFCGYRRTGERIPKRGPLLVVASHQGMMDFLTVADALPGRRVQFIATRRFFRSPKLRFFLRADGAIPKTQFHPDPACILEVLRTLRGGGTVALFPAGQTSVCGLPETIAPSIARLIKKANAPVCAVRQHGGFYTLPRLRPSRPCFGRVEAETRIILTPAQLKTLSEAEIYRAVVAGIDFDEAAWQARTGVRFRGGCRAAGLEGALWLCPRCGAEYALRGERNTLRCRACGAAAEVGPDMRFSAGFPETITAWYRLQETRLRAALAEENFALETPAEASSWDGDRFAVHGRGTLRLDRGTLSWRGVWDGAERTLAVRCETLAGLTVERNELFEVFTEDCGLIRFRPDDRAVVPKWKQAQELLYRQMNGLDAAAVPQERQDTE